MVEPGGGLFALIGVGRGLVGSGIGGYRFGYPPGGPGGFLGYPEDPPRFRRIVEGSAIGRFRDCKDGRYRN